MSHYENVSSFERNLIGNDYVVGDIHGSLNKLERAMALVGFNFETDRLFCTGDLIDRGGDNLQVLKTLKDSSWFYSIKGNHEQLLLDHFEGEVDPFLPVNPVKNHVQNGGRWFFNLREDTRQRVYSQIKALPLVIEIETSYGRIGLVHAEVGRGYTDWGHFVSQIHKKSNQFDAMWSVEIIRDHKKGKGIPFISREIHGQNKLPGIDFLIHGHYLVEEPFFIGNRYFIDTGLNTGEITIVKIENLPSLSFSVV
ncbi:MAG: metallophosphoesterase [Methyloprofundus sp.]|nr:metallophosphoesterase [Methyloprofundus sp.]